MQLLSIGDGWELLAAVCLVIILTRLRHRRSCRRRNDFNNRNRNRQHSYLVFSIYNLKIKNSFMNTIKDNEQYTFGISGEPDSKGEPTVVTVESIVGDNNDVAEYSLNVDGVSGTCKAGTKLGVANATITCKDADGNTVTATISTTVIAQDAKSLVITPNAPTGE